MESAYSVTRLSIAHMVAAHAYTQTHTPQSMITHQGCIANFIARPREQSCLTTPLKYSNFYLSRPIVTRYFYFVGWRECSKMPTLRKIVIFFSVDCNRSTY